MNADRPEWCKRLLFGLPDDFDFGLIRTEDDAELLMQVLPNRDRGVAALRLFEALGARRDKHVVNSGLMEAWDHDHGGVLAAFGDEQGFADALRTVAKPFRRKRPVRAWRGVSSPQAAYGISWTTDRDVACWFAMRFRDCHSSPLVFVADISPDFIITEHNERSERELLVDPLALAEWVRVVLDDPEGGDIGVNDLLDGQQPSQAACDDWQLAYERQVDAIRRGNARRLARLRIAGENKCLG
jgi:hypothetical protein